MNPPVLRPACSGCISNRRRFLATGCAACAGALGSLMPAAWLQAAAPGKRPPRNRIRLVYSLHAAQQPGPDWPNIGYDFRPVIGHIYAELTDRCPGYEFVSSLAQGPEDAAKLVAEDASAGIDGYVVFQMNPWNKVVQTVATTGKPVLYVDYPYAGSGGFLIYNAGFLRQGSPNVGFVSSSQLRDIAEAVKCFDVVARGGSTAEFVAATRRVRIERTPRDRRPAVPRDALQTLDTSETLRRMKASKILAVRGTQSGPADTLMGIPVVHVPFAEVNAAWEAADRDEARAVAVRWVQAAARVQDVSPQTLEDSAAMYLAQKAVMKRHGANAITINCLGGFYGGHIHAYPCLGFHQLLNEGLVGACECDVRSTATMVAMTHLTQGRPGYISDPVIDTSKRQIIYAHCVASNRAFGPDGATNRYEILTHSEDRQGASVRSLLPLEFMTTTLEFAQERKEVLLHRARAVANDLNDRACRTKLAAEPVGDLERLFTLWDHWGWHRVTYYGDLKEPVAALADALGWKLVEEA